jgi:hypothetical protein
MKLLSFIVGVLAGTIVIMNIKSYCVAEEYESKINQLRRDKRMYDSLYRAANARLIHFQDSVNRKCICK